MIESEAGHTAAALGYAEAAVAIAADLGSDPAEGYWLLQLGDAQRAVGRPADAMGSYHSAILQQHLGDRGREAAAWDGAGQAYRELDRPEEALDLHRRAAAVHLELGDHWHTALTLSHLAAALDAASMPQDAAQSRSEALLLLAEFTDPRALDLRERLTRAQASPDM